MDAAVVAVVQDDDAGAGLALAAAADVVLAGASARFTLASTKIGVSPDGREGVRAFLAKPAPDFPSAPD